ncbi:recombinase family protein [Novosphingobium flavum]|uniref:Recombinase family protein n=1 Tax=Novosphingobium flavum TaxID=1778672 RepID=A0A7X1KK70_9SPHN|nr:recombinase family protein [Novosphingobium flavum]MBC2664226.1 recombinase family protein [Novosphingobium flavum]
MTWPGLPSRKASVRHLLPKPGRSNTLQKSNKVTSQSTRRRGRKTQPVVPQAVLYARVSTLEQQREGYSIPAQVKLLEDYAALNGIAIMSTHIDVETARKRGRTAFGAMLGFLRRNPQVRILLVEKTDRLYRNLSDWATVDDLGVDVHLVKENAVMSQACRSSEKFVHGIKVLMAKAYVDNLSEEARKGMLEKARQGHWPSFAPIGYRNVQNDAGRKVIEVDPVLGPQVARLFEWFATGSYSVKSLTAKAAAAGLGYRKSGSRLGSSAVYTLLRNRIYTGRFDWNGETYSGVHGPLISQALWDSVQSLLDERGPGKQHSHIATFPFHGLIKCGHCGCAMVAEIKKQRYIYYHCTGYRGKCPEPYLRQERLEAHLVSALQRLHYCTTAALRIEQAIKGQGRGGAAQPRDNAGVTSIVRDDERMIRQGLELMEMARLAFLALPGLPIVQKRRMLGLLLGECTWANGALTVNFAAPFDLLEVYVGTVSQDGDADELLAAIAMAFGRPAAVVKQLIARYNAMVRCQQGEAERARTGEFAWSDPEVAAA